MAKAPDVSLNTWKELYAEFLKFGDLKPWEIMEDSQIFGIRDPATGQMGYACVLGALGEVLALCVYRGSEGFDVHQRMQRGEVNVKTDDIFALQNCLMAEFENREELDKPDRDVVRQLGLRFRGSKSWPLFRSYLPGYFPWHLTEPEAVFLTAALRCARDVVRQVAQGRLCLDEKQDKVFCFFQKENISGAEFETRWEPKPIYKPAPLPPLVIDPERISRLQAKFLKPAGAWEADASYLPMPTMDRDRPYLTRLVLLVEAETGVVMSTNAVPPENLPHQSIAEAVLQSMEKTGLKPVEIHLRDEITLAALSPLDKALGLRLKIRNPLSVIPHIRRELIKLMAK